MCFCQNYETGEINLVSESTVRVIGIEVTNFFLVSDRPINVVVDALEPFENMRYFAYSGDVRTFSVQNPDPTHTAKVCFMTGVTTGSTCGC